MNDLSPMSDLIADDLFLDRLAGRVDAGSEPLAGLLGALATQADTPLPSRTGRRRIANKHRYLGAFAALAVAASGAGVAAAVTLPANGPSQADRARIVKLMDDSARSEAPSALLSRLGLPQTSRSSQEKGLVLVRRADGSIVLVPAAVAAAQRQAVAAGATVVPGAPGTQQADGRPSDPGQPGSGTDGLAQGGNGQGGKGQGGNGQGGNGQGGNNGQTGNGQTGADGTTTDLAGQGSQGGTRTGTPQGTNNGKKPVGGTGGGKKPTPSVAPTPTPSSSTDALVTPQTTLAPPTTARTSANTAPRPTSTPTPKATTPKGKVRGTAPGAPASTSDAGSAGPTGSNGSSASQGQAASGSSAGAGSDGGAGGSGSAATGPGRNSGSGSGQGSGSSSGSGKGAGSAAGNGGAVAAVGSLVDGVVAGISPSVVPAEAATRTAAGRTTR